VALRLLGAIEQERQLLNRNEEHNSTGANDEGALPEKPYELVHGAPLGGEGRDRARYSRPPS
jgi:hypothetical protein